jgi:hypothetical protein
VITIRYDNGYNVTRATIKRSDNNSCEPTAITIISEMDYYEPKALTFLRTIEAVCDSAKP